MAAQSLHLDWYNPVRIRWGTACFQQLSLQQPVVVLADRAALSYENETLLLERLGHHCKAWSWFQGGLASVALAQALCDELWPVLHEFPQATVLAVGGGSTLDLAKVLRYRMDDIAAAADCWRDNRLPPLAHRHALWLVPTTAGTGSEVTCWATLWDTEVPAPTKLSWAPADGFAEQAWVDPELSYTCPLRQSRDCALDTLSHALESLWNRNSNPISEALAVDAAHLVLQALPALGDPMSDLARAALARASLLAGMAMSQTQTALAHALSYELTLKEDMPHGAACAVWLPMVWDLAVGANSVSDAALGRIFSLPPRAGAERLSLWLQARGIAPRDLRSSALGRNKLEQEILSARGRNFVGICLTETSAPRAKG